MPECLTSQGSEYMASAVDGSIKISTKLDTEDFQKGVSNLQSVAQKGLKAVTVALGAVTTAFGAAAKVGMEFEASMSKVQAISGATGEDLEALTEKAKQMGIDTAFSASEAAEAMQYMAMAGWKTEDMLNGIEGVMNLAAASGEELGTVSDIVTDALTAFGLKAQDSAHFADVLAAASSNANTNVSMMGGTFQYVAPVAGAMGFSIEDTAQAIGLMANAGIKAEKAGTALRSIFTRLAKPPKEAAEAMDALNLSVTNSDGSFKSLGEILTDLRTKFSKLTAEQKTQYAAAIGGQEAMSGLLAIVNAAPEDFDKLSAAIQNADGSAQEMADTMLDNLKGQITLMGSSLEGLGIAIYDGIEQPLKEAAKAGITSINTLTDSIKSGELQGAIQNVGTLFANLVTTLINLATAVLPTLINGLSFIAEHLNVIISVIGALVIGITAYKTVVGIATAAQLAWNAAINANPIGLAITAIVALVSGIALLATTTDKYVSEQEKEIQKTREHTQALKEKRDAYEKEKAAIEENMQTSLVEIDYVKRQWQELQKLVDEHGNLIGSKERAKFLVDEINRVMPGTISWINEERLAVEGVTDAITKQIAQQRAKIILDAQKENYDKAILNVDKALQENTKAKIALDEQENKIASIKNEMIQAQTRLEELKVEMRAKGMSEMLAYDTEEGSSLNVLLGEKKNALIKEQALLDEKKAAYKRANSDYEEYLDVMQTYEQMSAEMSAGNYEAINQAVFTSGQRRVEIEKATREEVEEQLWGNAAEYEQLKQDYINAGSDTEKSLIKSRIEALEAEGPDLLNRYQSLGGDVTTSLADGSLEKSYFLNETMNGIMQSAVTAANSHQDEFVQVGENAGNGIAEGIRKSTNAAAAAMKTSSGTVLAAALKAYDIHSPSRVMRDEVGIYIAEGIAVGIEDGTKAVESAIDTLAERAIGAAQDRIDRENPGRIGKDELGMPLLDGMAAGIKEKSWEVAEEFEKLMDDLDLQRDLGVISEADYYRKMESYRDGYLERGTKDWWEYTKKIISYEQGVVEEQKQSITDLYTAAAEAAKKSLEEIVQAQETLSAKLKDYGELYETTTTVFAGAGRGLYMEDGVYKYEEDLTVTTTKLRDLKPDIQALEDYKNLLLAIKDRGTPDELFDIIRDMSVEEGTAFAKALMGATDEDYAAYIADWQAKQNIADQIAREIIPVESNEIKDAITQSLEEAGYEVPEGFYDIGEQSAESLGNGFMGKLDSIFDSMTAAVNAKMQELSAMMTVNVAAAGAGVGGATTYYDNRSTSIYASSTSPHAIIEAQKQNEIYQQHTKKWE